MRSIRRVGALAAAGVLLTAVASGPVGAQTTTPASYTGTASGYALKVALGPQNLTAGSSAAKAASDGTGEATGSGISSVPVSPLQASTTATAKNPPGETKPEVCGDSALNAVETALRDVIKVGLGCGSASATGTGVATIASATGKVAALDVSLANLVDALPIAPQLEGGINQVDGGLTTVCAALPAQPAQLPLPPLCQTLDQTVSALLSTIQAGNLVSAEFGSSVSGVSVAGASVTSESTASGAIVKIAPTPMINGVPLGEPLATITVARANAKVLCDLGSGNAVPSFDPAIVRVKLAGPLAALIPAPVADAIPAVSIPAAVAAVIGGTVDPTVTYKAGEFTVTPGASLLLFPGTPIETEIVAGAGTSKVNPDRSASASADGVKIHALKNVGTGQTAALAPLAGGLLVNLAHAETAGACVAAVTTAAPPPAVETPRELPRTGGDSTPWVPVAGLAGLALVVISRRALVRSN